MHARGKEQEQYEGHHASGLGQKVEGEQGQAEWKDIPEGPVTELSTAGDHEDENCIRAARADTKLVRSQFLIRFT